MPKKTSTVRKPPRNPVQKNNKSKRSSKKSKSPTKYETHSLVLPAYWDLEIKIRQTGKTKGHLDKYFHSPDGDTFRSIVQMNAEIETQSSDGFPPPYYKVWYINGTDVYMSLPEWADKKCTKPYKRPESEGY